MPNNENFVSYGNAENIIQGIADKQVQRTIMPAASVDYVGKIYQYIGATTETLTRGFFYICESNGNGGYVWNVLDVEPDDSEPTQFETMPTAEADREGEIVQYIGETDADYTNGYFYKCVYKNDSWTWVNVEVQTGSSGVTSGGKYKTYSIASNYTGYVLLEAQQRVNLPAAQYIIAAGGSQYLLSVSKHQLSDTVLYHLSGDANAITNFKVTWSSNPNGIVLSFDHTMLVNFEQIAGANITSFSKITSITQRQIDDLFDVPVKDLTISDSQTIQYNTMPTAGTAYVDKIVQYTGTDTNDYKNGYFYKCISAEIGQTTSYRWAQTDVQPNGGTDVTSRQEKQITTANDFRTTQGSYSFITTTAVTITLADAETITIPANTQGFFDVGETDEDTGDYAGVIQYVVNGREKTVYFNSLTFTLPATDNVQIDDTTVSTTSTYSSSKIETTIGGSKAAQMTGATSYQDGKAGLATKPVAGDNQKALFGDGRYHTIYAANTGSTIVVVTDEPTLYGRPVTLTAGSTTLTGTFSNIGECTFSNLAIYGAVQIASEDAEGNPARGSTNITYFGTYVVGIGFNFATIKFTSSDVSLAGVPVAIYKDDVLVAETSLSVVGSGQLEATTYVEELGTYKAIAQTSGGTARASVTVTALRQTYTKELIVANIYGFQIDHKDSNPATCVQPYSLGDYEVINADFTPAHMDYTNDVFNYGSWTGLATCDRNEIFFAPKPCMLRYDGTVAYYLDPDDYSKKADGTASDVTDMSYNGNVMVEFPTIYFKRWQDGDKSYCLIANKQLDANFHAWAHHDKNGAILPYIYLAAYECSYDGTKIRSISGQTYKGNDTWQQAYNFAAENNTLGENGEGWSLLHKADLDMLISILILIGANTNVQAQFGNGNINSSAPLQSGPFNNSGMFYGKDNSVSCIKALGIESIWGDYFKRLAGYIYVSGTQKIKYTYGQEDGSTTDGFNSNGNGYVTIIDSSISSSGYIKNWEYSEYGIIPLQTGGSSTTYLCDNIWISNSGITMPTYGGAYNQSFASGIFCLGMHVSAETTSEDIGCSLSYKGIASP